MVASGFLYGDNSTAEAGLARIEDGGLAGSGALDLLRENDLATFIFRRNQRGAVAKANFEAGDFSQIVDSQTVPKVQIFKFELVGP